MERLGTEGGCYELKSCLNMKYQLQIPCKCGETVASDIWTLLLVIVQRKRIRVMREALVGKRCYQVGMLFEDA